MCEPARERQRRIRKGAIARVSVPYLKRYKPSRKAGLYIMESLILAQNKRWRRVLSMQVGRQAL